MELGLNGKTALVTGSSRGIGRGIAEALAAEGCDLMLTGRDEKALEEAASAIRAKGRRAAISMLDLREPGATEKLIDHVKREFGGLDILVNNAGATKRGDFLDAHRRRLGGRLCAEIFCPYAARPRRLAAVEVAARLAGADRRHRRTQTARAIHHRQFGQCSGRGLHQMPRRSRQDRWRPRELHPSEPGRDRPQWRRSRPRSSAPACRRKKSATRSFASPATFRFGTVEDVGDLVTFIVSSRASWLHGTTIDLDGGEIPVCKSRPFKLRHGASPINPA